jgi:ADP-ribosylglycohydrolase
MPDQFERLLAEAESQRAIACFKGLSTGDAIGKQSENLTRSNVLYWYPQGIHGFQGQPGQIIPRYVGNQNRQWRIGETTDDTEQTIAVSRAILRDQRVIHTSVGQELLSCMKSVHSGVRSMWAFKQAGDFNRVANDGDGCGAAMRVAPVGIRYSSHRFDDLLEGAYEASISTHGGQLAISAAAAVAVAVSVALDGGTARDVLMESARAAKMAETFRPSLRPVTIASAIQNVHDDLSRLRELDADNLARKCFPDRPETKVPLAISLAVITKSAEATILLAANIGGDADSVASIGGAIAGALDPATINQDWFDVVNSINDDDLPGIARSLATLRNA